MTYVETRINVWEALAGRGTPLAPADPGLWGAVVERLNPARARPVLRAGIEAVTLTGVRGSEYVMLRSPDDRGRACYLRLTPDEWQLALMMDGNLTVARLVAEFARIAGRLAPDQVRRVVADLAGNRMLEELPVDAFRSLEQLQRRPVPARIGRGLLAVARGRRMLVVDVDRLVTGLYRAGGRLFFGRTAAVLLSLVAVVGFAVFVGTWWRGSQSVFLTGGSYLAGAITLLVLNVVALASHELGHALATKHAGREVPAAGVLVYFGIPSVFVDTTDVWMAGRRARMLTTAAGPATGLVLAGAGQLIGLAVPALGPLVFKLAFAWYLNALFNLNPFLALDGYYLLMDWLEIPNLRARGLSWVGSRLRGRPPRWSGLDREGRLVALYGVLAVLWLVIAANLAYRVWADRVTGLATGLWHSGAAARLLLVLVLVGLCLPVLYLAAGRVATWWRRWRLRAAERERAADVPRRLAALRASDLGGLPEPALAGLAARARWVRPPTGRQLVVAGSPPSAVYVVVEGAMQARMPGDPGGTIRHHVVAGGVIGLANALTGRAATLNWHTAGTTLLTLSPATIATVVGPPPGPPPRDRAEAETLYAEAPALTALAADERLALIAASHPVDLEAGAPVVLPGPTHAVVVESGVIALPDGVELRRGTLVGPVGDGVPGVVALTRTPVRLWVIPDASVLPPLVGAARRTATGPAPVPGRTGPTAGVHPVGTYPPLAVPPGPPEDADPEVDRRFERRLWWLVLLVFLCALLLTGTNLEPGPAWAEMPVDRALLTADRGQLTVTLDGRAVTLAEGDRRYVDAGARIEASDSSLGRLRFHGGAATLLCGGSQTLLTALSVGDDGRRAPAASITLERGRLLADTTSTSGAYLPLALRVASTAGQVVNDGVAWFAVDPGATVVSTGVVSAAGSVVSPTRKRLSCADGVPVEPPAAGPTEPPTTAPAEEPSETPSPSPSPSPSATLSPTAATLPTPTLPEPIPTMRRTNLPGTTPSRTKVPSRTPSPSRTPAPPTTDPPTTEPEPNPTTTPPEQIR